MRLGFSVVNHSQQYTFTKQILTRKNEINCLNIYSILTQNSTHYFLNYVDGGTVCNGYITI